MRCIVLYRPQPSQLTPHIYSATKFAVRAMTQSAGKVELPYPPTPGNFSHCCSYLRTAAEFGKYRITVNAYCPGNIDTPMSSSSSHVCSRMSFFLHLEIKCTTWSLSSRKGPVQIQKPSGSRCVSATFLLLVVSCIFCERLLIRSLLVR